MQSILKKIGICFIIVFVLIGINIVVSKKEEILHNVQMVTYQLEEIQKNLFSLEETNLFDFNQNLEEKKVFFCGRSRYRNYTWIIIPKLSGVENRGTVLEYCIME